jgi:hypothetical protein
MVGRTAQRTRSEQVGDQAGGAAGGARLGRPIAGGVGAERVERGVD